MLLTQEENFSDPTTETFIPSSFSDIPGTPTILSFLLTLTGFNSVSVRWKWGLEEHPALACPQTPGTQAARKKYSA